MDPWDIDPEAEELLERNCSFALQAAPTSMLDESDLLEYIAGDGCGGCFYLWHEQSRDGKSPVVYLSSYGEASRFAKDFDTALTILVEFPNYWEDMLVAAHKGGGLVERSIAHYEGQMRDQTVDVREKLYDLLDLDTSLAAESLVAAVQFEPPFTPMISGGKTLTVAGSFANRPFPE